MCALGLDSGCGGCGPDPTGSAELIYDDKAGSGLDQYWDWSKKEAFLALAPPSATAEGEGAVARWNAEGDELIT